MPQPPVGPLRWQPPAPAPPWPGVRDATRLGPALHAGRRSDLELGRHTDEDCLTLNVWTPAGAGGRATRRSWCGSTAAAFINGSGGIYDSRWLAVARRRRRRHAQLPARRAGLPRASRARAGRRGRQLRPGRPAGRAALGARQHRRIRRRPGQGHHRRRVGGRHVGVRPPRRAGVGGTVPGGDHPERAVSGAGRRCPTRSGSASTTRATSVCGDPATAARLPARAAGRQAARAGVVLPDRRRRAQRAGDGDDGAARWIR